MQSAECFDSFRVVWMLLLKEAFIGRVQIEFSNIHGELIPFFMVSESKFYVPLSNPLGS